MREEILEAIEQTRERIIAVNGLHADDFLPFDAKIGLKEKIYERLIERLEEIINE